MESEQNPHEVGIPEKLLNAMKQMRMFGIAPEDRQEFLEEIEELDKKRNEAFEKARQKIDHLILKYPHRIKKPLIPVPVRKRRLLGNIPFAKQIRLVKILAPHPSDEEIERAKKRNYETAYFKLWLIADIVEQNIRNSFRERRMKGMTDLVESVESQPMKKSKIPNYYPRKSKRKR